MLYNITIFSIIFGVGIIGICSCFITFFLIHRSAVLHNAYGIICAVHSICELIILLTFTFWGAPVLLFKDLLQDELFGAIIGIICSFAYYIALNLQFLKSINRFCAIILPIQYRSIFASKNLIKIFAFIFVISLLTTLPYFWHSCNFYFSRDYFTWTVRDEKCYSNFIIYLDMGTGCISSAISFCCDATTFCYLYLMGKKINKNNHATMPREIRFFFQACITSCLYTVIISFHILSKFATDEWLAFITTTMAWLLCHTLNEIFFIFFNYKHHHPTVNVKILGKSTTVDILRARNHTTTMARSF